MKYSKIIRETIEEYISKNNIEGVIFDFDYTLVDTSCYRPYREYAIKNKDWSIFDEHIKETKLYPGIKKLIYYLHNNGIKILVVTDNKQSVASKTLNYHGIYYDMIAGSQGWQNPKWRRMTRLINKLELNPNNVISVGDLPSDALQSEKAHIKFIGCNWGNNKVNGINNPIDLIDIIESYNNKG